MRSAAISLALVLAGSGCSQSRNVDVVSDPPGARIMVNNDYRGDTPLTITISRQLGESAYKMWVVEAYPPPSWGAGMFVQKKIIDPSYGDVPSRMFFDMRLVPAAPRQSIEVQNR